MAVQEIILKYLTASNYGFLQNDDMPLGTAKAEDISCS
jgi:hypothetical protein